MGKEVPVENGVEIRRTKASSGSDQRPRQKRHTNVKCDLQRPYLHGSRLPNRLALGKLLRALRDHSSTTATILGASGLRA